MKAVLLSVAAALLSGCAPLPVATPEAVQAANTPLVCSTGPQCQRFWQRAQIWLTKNSTWKIQTATEAVITTFNGTESSTERAFTVIKEPRTDGKEVITITSGCRNIFGCVPPDQDIAHGAFKIYVRGGE